MTDSGELKKQASQDAYRIKMILDDLSRDENCMLTLSISYFLGCLMEQINSNHVPENFTGVEFKYCMARACRGIADRIQKHN